MPSHPPIKPNLMDPAFWSLARTERHAHFDALRAAGPIVWQEDPEDTKRGGFWAVLNHAGCMQVEKTPDVFSSRAGGVRIADMPVEFLDRFANMIHMDPPEHTRLRRLTARAFAPAALRNLDDGMLETANTLIDKALRSGGFFDIVEHVAAPFPLHVICQIMSVPQDRFAEVLKLTNAFLGAEDPELRLAPGQSIQESRHAGAAGLTEILDEILDGDAPVGSMLETLLQPDDEGNRLTRDELRRYFLLLIAAGTEAARQTLGHGLLLLAAHPEQAGAWRTDPDELTKTAVEEILRMATTTIHMRRTAICDTDVQGTPITTDDKVVIYYQAANRDPDVFADPHKFDIRRRPNPHLAFGAQGPHYCLGAALARRELSIVFQTLFRKVPDLKIVGAPEYMASDFIDGIKSLNVEVS